VKHGCSSAVLWHDGVDCDDTREDVNPGEDESLGTGFDDNCDGSPLT